MIESDTNTETTAGATVPPAPSPVPESIQVWVCPQCGSWAGSSSMPDLATIKNRRSSMRNLATEDPSEWGKSTGPRSICQICRQQGEGDFERVLTIYVALDCVNAALENQVEASFRHEEKGSGVRLRRPDSHPREAPDS